MHSGLSRRHPAFEMVASRAGGYHIGPLCFSTEMARDNVINGQVAQLPAAILAGEIIPPENLLARKLYNRAGTLDHPVQAYDGRQGKSSRNRVNDPASIQDQRCFISQNQVDCPISGGYINWLEIRV